MFRIFRTYFFDPDPVYGGWFSLYDLVFAIDEISAILHVKKLGWGAQIKVKEV